MWAVLILLQAAAYGPAYKAVLDARQPAAKAVGCASPVEGEIVVCKRAGEQSPYRYRDLGPPPGIAGSRGLRVYLPGGTRLEAGGPPESVGVTLKIPF